MAAPHVSEEDLKLPTEIKFIVISSSLSSLSCAASTEFSDSLSLSLSLAIRLYHLSHSSGPLDSILCPYRAVVDKF